MPALAPRTKARNPVCEQCAIRHRGICSALNREEIGELNAIAVRKQFDAGQVVQWQNDDATTVGNLLDGVLKVTRTLDDGRVQIVGLLFPGDFLGRAFASETVTNIEAATSCEICTFPRTRFEAVLRRFPDLEDRLFARTLDELDAAQDLMLLLGRKTASERVATFLVQIGQRQNEAGCSADDPVSRCIFDLPLTRADMADFLGLTIETVSRQITRLRKAGIISVVNNRTVEILQPKRLLRASGEPE